MKKIKDVLKNSKLKYILKICLLLIAYICVYLIIVYVFTKTELFPAEEVLEKKDWLGFFGTYLAFVGTTVLSIFALWHTCRSDDRINAREEREWRKRVEPIFSIKIVEQNSLVPGYAVILNPERPETYPKFDNFTITIENLSEFPALHVCVFEEYLFPTMKQGEVYKIQAAFSDSDDVRRYKNGFKVVLDNSEEQVGSKEHGGRLPKAFNICYEDVDGRPVYKTYNLSEMNGKKFYSLIKTEVVAE